jgi:hypothetical protein
MQHNSRRRLIYSILGALTLSKIGVAPSFAQSNYFVPGFLINLYLKNRFPINKDILFLKIALSDPDLGFISQNQRLAMSSAFSAALANTPPVNGQLHFSSSFIYDATNKSIRLKDPAIDRLNIQNVSEKDGQSLKQLNVWIAKILENMTVYEFKENEIPLLKKPPSKILVEDAGLRLFFD